jgi:4-hydroxyphenylpyruvate dioxygenase
MSGAEHGDMSDTTATSLAARESETPVPVLLGFDHLHWWVGNARQAAHFWAAAFGFGIVAYAGPETGQRDRVSYVLEQGAIRFVVTSPLGGDSAVAQHVRRHGDGVRDIAYQVHDAAGAFALAVARGAGPLRSPVRQEDEHGVIVRAAVRGVGDTVHSFVERHDYRGRFVPGYEAPGISVAADLPPVGLLEMDHVVTNVATGDLDPVVAWYGRVFGFGQLQHFDDQAVATEYSSLRSTVVSNGKGVVQPVNEPAPGRRGVSQIQEFLDYYDGPGVQHVALSTDDIVAAVTRLRDRGVRLMAVPPAYYDEAPARMAGLGDDLPWATLADLGILVDRDGYGYLLQIFTENVTGRPTAFVEIIQRCGARGFGEGNFKALFTSIESEQARRGNLVL